VDAQIRGCSKAEPQAERFSTGGSHFADDSLIESAAVKKRNVPPRLAQVGVARTDVNVSTGTRDQSTSASEAAALQWSFVRIEQAGSSCR
jgi:type IV pilus biogenesis protein CpaD/CtpE